MAATRKPRTSTRSEYGDTLRLTMSFSCTVDGITVRDTEADGERPPVDPREAARRASRTLRATPNRRRRPRASRRSRRWKSSSSTCDVDPTCPVGERVSSGAEIAGMRSSDGGAATPSAVIVAPMNEEPLVDELYAMTAYSAPDVAPPGRQRFRSRTVVTAPTLIVFGRAMPVHWVAPKGRTVTPTVSWRPPALTVIVDLPSFRSTFTSPDGSTLTSVGSATVKASDAPVTRFEYSSRSV